MHEQNPASTMGTGYSRGRLLGGRPCALTTHWGTTLYCDSAGNLRHAKMHVSETNVVFMALGSADRPLVEGILLAEDSNTFRVMELVEPGVCQWRPLSEPTDLSGLLHLYFLGDDRVSLKGRRGFFAPEADGAFVHDRPWRRDWEIFRTAAIPAGKVRRIAKATAAQTAVLDALRERIGTAPIIHLPIRRSPVETAVRGVVLCAEKWLRTYLASEHHHLVEHLHLHLGFDVIDTISNDLESDEVIGIIDRYDVVLVAYEEMTPLPLNRLSTFKVLKIDDLTDMDWRMAQQHFLAANSDMIVGPYAYELPRHFPHPCIRWLPYSSALAQDGGLLPFNDEPIDKLFASGSLAPDRPFRQFVFDLDDPRIVKLHHPGYYNQYDGTSDDIVKSRWFAEIRKYICAFCDAHSLRYIHLRVFEIASVGTLLLADDLVRKEMGELGFIDGDTCVFCNRENFLEKLDWILAPENRVLVDRIRRRGMELCRGRHLTATRAQDLVKLIETEMRRVRMKPFENRP